jgi:hypothetical protein
MSHTCGVRICTKEIAPSRLMCADDWKRVPYKMQTDVWKYYRKGQNALTASQEYLKAAQAAIDKASEVREEERAQRGK